MLSVVKKKWRKLHVSKTQIKLLNVFLFDKKKFKVQNLTQRTPNLILVGSQKCGTTSLHNYLNEHPDIYMSFPFKEPGFFFFNEWGKTYWQERGYKIASKNQLKKKYMIQNFKNEKYFGESSTHYTIDTRETSFNIPQKIKALSPNAKIIYLIRNPFERIISAYYHFIKYLHYKGTLDSFIQNDEMHINTTLYFQRIKPFLDTFGKQNLLILQFENLINEPQNLVNKVYKFLDVVCVQHEKFGKFNTTTPSNTERKISSESYTFMIDKFTHEKEMLEQHFDIKINWDLSTATWIN